ncbi:alpha-N-acetyl-neuraminyl-2,3-beta-galactosyl-1,3-N-acetyl-galactosaminide alpha-2,6-sialyltransferase isoform X1 [Sarcophilus harrisii]|uniref:alpha-N-acetylneuraminyl-2,3-beta-galactosyl-1,3-N-acetylgalactosaminide6-alpha-sialyltransferase n=2 Tax=Sarcophilus harrisii TaxID=9305 RepID=A0A7N4UYA6_SARHA|nr:alpha-N-acetyl-neuraminyl-2,3-beta-galactosyl-1,3-N-acetyl-galactosaminide alpha-2,6-sialyltransferase isoform X1 [Sarcophilus harrisii]
MAAGWGEPGPAGPVTSALFGEPRVFTAQRRSENPGEGRLFSVPLCFLVLIVLYVLLCNQLCMQLCWKACLASRQPRESLWPTVPGSLHFQGYSSVPDGKPLVHRLCRRCALVSSSGQMLGSHWGPEIDGTECVLRMNQAPTAGYEADVGHRSTLRMVSHTSVPLLLRNQSYFFQQARDTVYVVWGPGKRMNRDQGGSTYRTLLKVKEMYPGVQLYTLTDHMMAYCDEVFQNETGKNRMKSGSFLSTGWFTMILAMELCEQIVVYGMVSDSYCREKSPPSVPYHYFEKGKLDECHTYLVHEKAPRGAHRFITEKAIFSRWAKKKPIIFTHPSWQSE